MFVLQLAERRDAFVCDSANSLHELSSDWALALLRLIYNWWHFYPVRRLFERLWEELNLLNLTGFWVQKQDKVGAKPYKVIGVVLDSAAAKQGQDGIIVSGVNTQGIVLLAFSSCRKRLNRYTYTRTYKYKST